MKCVRCLTALLVLGLALILDEAPASAQSCGVSATTVSFGLYDGASSADATTTGNVNYWCQSNSKAFPVTIYLSKGMTASIKPRKMTPYSGNDRLTYDLYLDPARTQIWGDPNPYCYRATVAANTWANVNVPIYGVIPNGQDVSPGTYRDEITVTLLF